MAIQHAPGESRHLIPVEELDPPRSGRLIVGPWPDVPTRQSLPSRGYALSVSWWQAIAALVAGWAYPEAASRRDLRLDLLRGLCVFAMLVDHLGGESWLYAFTGGNQGFVSAAEGFIFISGLVLGQVYRVKIRKLGLKPAVWQALRRARTLYVATVVLTLFFAMLRVYTEIALWVPRSVSFDGQSLPELILSTVTLHLTYHGTDILAMYVFCLLASGLALALLSFGRWWWVLAASGLVWLGYQLRPQDIQVPWYIHNSENFPFAAWQVLFMCGLVIGFQRTHISQWLSARPRAQRALMALAVAVIVVVALTFQASGDVANGIFAKVPLRPARLVAFGAVAIVAYVMSTLAWTPLRRALGWLLLPLGQHALYCYLVHYFVILLLMNIRPEDALLDAGWVQPVVLGTVLQLGLVFGVWGLVRRRVLFGTVPN